MIFGGKAASSLAKEALNGAITDFRELFSDMQKKDCPPFQDLLARLSKVEAQLDEASSLSDDAVKEPRFWRQTWRASFFTTTTDSFRRLCKLQRIVIHFTCDDKPECKELKDLCQRLTLAWVSRSTLRFTF